MKNGFNNNSNTNDFGSIKITCYSDGYKDIMI